MASGPNRLVIASACLGLGKVLNVEQLDRNLRAMQVEIKVIQRQLGVTTIS